jgi:hypothetical protein
MNQEKFVSSYVELLNSTLSEAIQKNIIIQSQKKVIELELEELKKYLSDNKNSFDSMLVKKEKEITDLKNEINEERRQKQFSVNENNELKKNSHHIETFKNQLLLVREENAKLISEVEKKDMIISSLQEEIKKNKEVEEQTKTIPKKKDKISSVLKKEQTEDTIKDAGNF